MTKLRTRKLEFTQPKSGDTILSSILKFNKSIKFSHPSKSHVSCKPFQLLITCLNITLKIIDKGK